MYYSSELANTGYTSPSDGYVRLDFPGGWATDKVNKFEAAGRTEKDNLIWNHIAALANFRKTSSALSTGKMMQYVPEDGLYVYFRYDAKQTIMIVMNTSKVEKKIIPAKYEERVKGFSNYYDVLGKTIMPLKDFQLGSYKTIVFELRK